MPIKLENVGIAVRDLEATIAFFTDLGLTVLGRDTVSGEWTDTAVGLDGNHAKIAMLQTPDGNGRLELFEYIHPDAIETEPTRPNEIGMHRVAFSVDDIDEALVIAARHGCHPLRGVATYGDVYKLSYVRGPSGIIVMLAQALTSDEFVPVGFDPPTSLATEHFRLEPLGPQHNEADHAAWMSSIEHIRSTTGYSDGSWPPHDGMTLEENLDDLRRHADDFTHRAGFTFTVLDPTDDDVIGCVYLYPTTSEEYDVTVRSWVRADKADLDVPLADAVARWIAGDWPWERVDRCGR
jgi:catechol 2,3-dioxygenase-like lactoylglutathione lyase family enzyme